MLLSDAIVGWSTVEASRKLVPDQNASKAVAPSTTLMVGSVTARDVASKALVKPSMHSAVKARMNSRSGLKTGVGLSSVI